MLSGGAGWGRGGEVNRGLEECWAWGGERVALCIPLFLLVLTLLLFTSFAVLLSCPYPYPRVLNFFFQFSSSLPGGGVTELPPGPLLLAKAKPRHLPIFS